MGLLTCLLCPCSPHLCHWSFIYCALSYQLPEPSISLDSTISDKDYESVVLMKLRQFEERKRLIKEMQEEDEQWSQLAASTRPYLSKISSPAQSWSDSHATGVTWLYDGCQVIISRLGWPLTIPAVQVFKENRGAETSPTNLRQLISPLVFRVGKVSDTNISFVKLL